MTIISHIKFERVFSDIYCLCPGGSQEMCIFDNGANLFFYLCQESHRFLSFQPVFFLLLCFCYYSLDQGVLYFSPFLSISLHISIIILVNCNKKHFFFTRTITNICSVVLLPFPFSSETNFAAILFLICYFYFASFILLSYQKCLKMDFKVYLVIYPFVS